MTSSEPQASVLEQPSISAVLLSPQRPLGERELLIVGCSLGTSSVLWEKAAAILGQEFDVVAWDLPGHGVSPSARAPFDMANLANAVRDLVDSIAPGRSFHYAGVSLGGQVGFQLALDHGTRLNSLTVLCSAPQLGTPDSWLERAQTVRTLGTPVMIQGSAQRWFAEGSMERDPATASYLLHALRDADRASYAFCCQALAYFDVTARLGNITTPVLGIAGAEDTVATPKMALDYIAAINQGAESRGELIRSMEVTLEQVAHLAPAEAPAPVAELMHAFITHNSQNASEGSAQ